ncbi:MAG TPA: hypothetical protein VFY18_11240 [Candidatus Limnocylindrales bacterium]|nr:hypothetical protein [Candidatus Limnocylindrales bacterium]
MFATDAGTAADTWRPQQFGDRRAHDIDDPIIEPLWTGPRVLALVDHDTVRMTDVDGADVVGHEEIRDDLARTAGSSTILVEAYLTPEPIQAMTEIASRDQPLVPPPGQVLTGMVFGQRGERPGKLAERTEEARRRTLDGMTTDVALVAVDLLWLDADPMLDVPLLERKRILESVVPESHLIRVGIHVRPPIDSWLGSWRLFGFNRLAYKGANSRYVPGEKNPHWALAEIPRR